MQRGRQTDLELLLQLRQAFQHIRPVAGRRHPPWQAVGQRLVAPAVLIAAVLAQVGEDKVFQEGQVSSIVRPKGFAAAGGLQPERQ